MNLFKSSKSRLTFPALTSRCCSDQVPVSVFVNVRTSSVYRAAICAMRSHFVRAKSLWVMLISPPCVFLAYQALLNSNVGPSTSSQQFIIPRTVNNPWVNP